MIKFRETRQVELFTEDVINLLRKMKSYYLRLKKSRPYLVERKRVMLIRVQNLLINNKRIS